MSNKNISNFDLGTPVTGDYLLIWDVSEGKTKKVYINRVVALAPDEAETFLLSGITSGRNVGSGEGFVFHSVQNNIAQFKTIKAGSNITITNNTGDITINATASAQSGIVNVGMGEGGIFHSNTDGSGKFKTIKAGSNVTITNNTGDITIAASTSSSNVSMVMTTGRGDSFLVPYGGEELSSFSWTAITFGIGDPVISLPAGNANCLIDFFFSLKRGSNGSPIHIKLRDTTNNLDLPGSYFHMSADYYPNGHYTIRVLSGISGPMTIRAYAGHGPYDETNLADPARMPQIFSTGCHLSYIKF